MSGAALGVLGAAISIGAWVLWFQRLQAVRVPQNRIAFHLAMGGAAALGVAALLTQPGLLGGIAAALAVLAGGAFLGLRLQSSQQRREPVVDVGGPILDFDAPDDTGETFSLSSLRGRPYLLKFFRGHW